MESFLTIRWRLARNGRLSGTKTVCRLIWIRKLGIVLVVPQAVLVIPIGIQHPYKWLPGNYEVIIFVGEEWKTVGRFVVRGNPPPLSDCYPCFGHNVHSNYWEDAAIYGNAIAMPDKSFQDYYPNSMAHCYGCGRLNEYGHQIQSYWDGDESICHFRPKSYHIAIPGYVYGGLLASLIDCHGTGTRHQLPPLHTEENHAMGTEPAFRFLTASFMWIISNPHHWMLNWRFAQR